ncbi:MAG: hypothetical protein OES13_00245 [Acidimicrobiia bacterium]|nr:hypothetical protein [Acidimicrobiia bacterium]
MLGDPRIDWDFLDTPPPPVIERYGRRDDGDGDSSGRRVVAPERIVFVHEHPGRSWRVFMICATVGWVALLVSSWWQ